MNRELYEKTKNQYLDILLHYNTTEEKLNYLKEIAFSIDMIDVWSDEDKMCSMVVWDLMEKLKKGEDIYEE